MGCCISKYKPNKTHSIDEFDDDDDTIRVQDKLVISQQANNKTPNVLPPNKISPSPPSPPSSTSSVSSFICTSSSSSGTESSSSVSSGTVSSVSSLKDRSFSNEFLWSCVKENPHIIRINSIKEASRGLATTKLEAQKLDSTVKSIVATVKHSSSTPQKRVRSSSPTPSFRQKSFRKDPERQNPSYILPSRGLRSPSPSRRFSGDSSRGLLLTTKESCSKRLVGNKVNPAANNPVSSSLRKENFRAASPSNSNSAGLRVCLKNRETFTHRIGSKIDEVAVAEALAHQNTDPIPMEDIDNPLISLDCFIFL